MAIEPFKKIRSPFSTPSTPSTLLTFLTTLTSLTLSALLTFPLPVSAATPASPSPQDIEFFEKQIRPILNDQCIQCHGAEKQKGGLRLDSREALLKGGDDNGPALVIGDPDKSPLILAVRQTGDLKMPKKGEKLSDKQIEALEAWIKMGAPYPASTANLRSVIPDPGHFWAFQPVTKPSPPTVQNSKWIQTPIDNFIMEKWEEKKLSPSHEADKRTWIRRVTYDLTGLPPTPEETEAFLADKSPGAFEKLVDRLLASPQYGEQWGRHWLDVVRYADTSGCNADFPISSAYKYRNYVITAFNQDKPYDQFLREQLAGDLLPSQTDAEKYEKIIATGYLAISRRFGSSAEAFHLTLEDTIDNVGKAMLGLSVSCARCHDHKFDPILTRDYYSLYGIFNSTRYAFPGTETLRHSKNFIPLAPAAEAADYLRNSAELASLDNLQSKLADEKKELERAEKVAREKAEARKALDRKDEEEKNEAEKEIQQKADENLGAAQADPKDPVKLPRNRSLNEVKAAIEETRAQQKKLEQITYPFEKAYAVSEGEAGDAKIQKKGDPQAPGDPVPRGFLTVLGGQTLPKDEKGSGRLELARWIADPKNPLTARVMVNRIWQYHFGKGLVQTPNDFGSRGLPPTHPKLLDYLAARFIEEGWSVKAIHKIILLSATYQQASDDNPRSAALEATNDLLWKFPRQRLSAEEIRDSLLFLGGELDLTMGQGHPFPPEKDWQYTQHKPFVANYPSQHRSIYLMQQRILKQPFMETFDGPDPNATTAIRPVTISPIQALFLMNDSFVHEQADHLAVRVGMAFFQETKSIQYAYELALGRPATPAEIRVAQAYLQKCVSALQEIKTPADQQRRRAMASFMRVLLSSNEFMFVE